jgi:hypothetical protein
VNGRAVLHTIDLTPETLDMTSEGDVTTKITIPRIEPTSSFRTLGVHLSPSGSNSGALKVLRNIVLDYCTNIKGSHLTRQEALTSYIQYLLPKLRFQPAVLSLSQQDCDKLTSTIFSALLPRLHINRHTARSIIFGPEKYGSLALPIFFITQGVDKLHLFLGHLRLQDRMGHLIHIDLTYLQLLSGYGSFLLNCPANDFKWLEASWLSSLWSFTSSFSLWLVYPNQWLIPMSRVNDMFIMDAF